MDAISVEHEKIDAINRKAWEIRVSDSRRCSYLCEEAIERSKSINYRKGIAEGLRTFGFALICHSQYDQAIELLDQAINIFRELGDECGRSDILEYYAIIARSRGDYKTSLEQLYSAYRLRKDNHYKEGETLALYQLGVTYQHLGQPEKALDFYLQCLDLAQQHNNRLAETYSIHDIGSIYQELQMPEEALKYLLLNLQIKELQGNKRNLARCLDKIGQSCYLLKDFDKANSYYLTSIESAVAAGDKKGQAITLLHLAQLELALSNSSLAYEYASRCLSLRVAIGDKKGQAEVLLLIIGMSNDRDALPLMKRAFDLAVDSGSPEILNRLHFRYYEYYKMGRLYDKALEHLEQYEKSVKEFHEKTFTQRIADMHTAHRAEQDQHQSEIIRLRTVELAGLHRENEQLKNDLDLAMDQLKALGHQLALREKDSLPGELITVIASEIQNPLNILSNIPVSGLDMTESIINEIRKGNNAEVIKIAGELKNDLKKTTVHGLHAESMLKLLFRHTQPTTGKKQLTDINNLIDEYLRLAYYGMRTKDKSFNADLDLHYEKTGIKINIIPDQVGRVIFNILNYAFQDINEKGKRLGETFEPGILITTKRESANEVGSTSFLLITITDNGNGISGAYGENLLQPLFSTNTGSPETLRGLSLSHDIIRAHNGDLKIDAREGEYTHFTIRLPIDPGTF